jgi:hypothetical protein
MFHSRPWKIRVSRNSERAALICGLTRSTPIRACVAPPWSVMTSQSSPNAAACLAWSMTR